jgi:hypothetical protein
MTDNIAEQTDAATTGAGATPPAGTETTTQAAPPPAQTARAFSQEDVDRIAAKAREEGRQSALKRSTKDDKEPARSPDIVEQVRVLDALSSVKLPTSKARESLVREIAAQKPDDLVAFARSWAEGMGFAQVDAAATPAAKPTPQNGRPQSDAGTPAVTTQGERSPNPLTWTSEDYDAYFRQHAKVPSNKYDVRNRDVYRAIRRMTEAQLANTEIYIGPPKR